MIVVIIHGSTPKYSTKEIAAYICKNQNAVLLLGSATPEISTYYKAKTGNIELLTMTKRPEGATLPEIDLVDMKEERLLGNTSIISQKLKDELIATINRGEQALLFLNRRGYTSYLTCKDCGKIFKCPNCDVALTYHKSNNLLLCHYCSHVEKNITVCPECGSANLVTGSIGTQKLEEVLKEIYPEITTIRMDADSTIKKDAHQKILDKFKNEKINVLIGTQMISKGHDIENVTLVGVLGADSLIAINDCMAAEKAFSNISQVSGRAGRSKLKGKVIIQTNDTENYILQAVKHHDYIDFYNKEIKFREKFGFPPFLDILLFEFSSKNFDILKSEVDRMYNILLDDKSGIYKVFSPRSPYVQKVNNKYRMNILIKTKISTNLYNLIYSKINEFTKKRKKEVTMSITKNPTFIN